MSMIKSLQNKFEEICEREGQDHRELTDEETEETQTSIFNNTGLYLAFSDVKKLFKAFVNGYWAKKNRPKRRGKDTNQPCLI